jgi:protein-disulfide isomerase
MSVSGWEAVLAVPVTPGEDHLRGRLDAPVSLVEYGDYQCPYCGVAHPVVEAVREAAGDALLFVFRHFPLTTIHPYALPAAEAAEAAGAQDAFWPYHDLLFGDQAHLEPPHLVARAAALGLDVERFEADLVAQRHLDRVQAQFLSGVRSGVNGTPTFFVNGVRHDVGLDFPSLMAAVENAANARARA